MMQSILDKQISVSATYSADITAAFRANFNDLAKKWISYSDVSEKSRQTYERAIRQFVNYVQDNAITEPTRDTIIKWREDLKATKKPATVQAYLAATKLFFRWTETEGLYPNIADHIKSGVKVDNRTHKKDYLTANQTGDLLQAIDRTTTAGKRDYAILSLMATTGLRTVSIINANIEDIRPAGDSVALYYKGKGRSEKSVYVKIAPPVETAIRDYLKDRAGADLAEPLFTSTSNRNANGRMTTRSISAIAKTHMIDIGLNDNRHTAHSLRHTAATLNLLNGGSLEETQQLLDHAKIDTTMIYAHALEREKNQSENRIAAAIFA